MKKMVRFLFLVFSIFVCIQTIKAEQIECIYKLTDNQDLKIAYDGKKIKTYTDFYDDEKEYMDFVIDINFDKISKCPTQIHLNQIDQNLELDINFSENTTYSLDLIGAYYSGHVYCGREKEGRVTDIPKKIPELTSMIIIVVQVLIPVILVLMGTIDLFKGITAGKEDEIKKGQQMFIKRLIVGAVIFFVVIIVKFFVSVIADTNSTNIVDCIDCFISNDCEEDYSK